MIKPATLLEPGSLSEDKEVATAQTPAIVQPSLISDLCELTKARLTTLVLVTTLAGFYVGWQGPMNWWCLFNTMFGTALVAAGAGALNQLLERGPDALMLRTRLRPLPAGRMKPDFALLVGFGLAVAGLCYLFLLVSTLSSFLAAVTLVSYVWIYTPLKRVTNLNTLVGAVPGALPPVIGWAAARGTVGIEAWVLFAILFCWQMPHFLAIAWMYREDYARGGFVMLTGQDVDGKATGRQAVNYAAGLLLVSLTPSLVGMAGYSYFFGAFLLGAAIVYCAVQMQLAPSHALARKLFFASILYLPLLLLLLALDKMPPPPLTLVPIP